ncbi:MAG: T9SS type A sorting domain-containing protein [Bacteroidetes bacterium]|nr:T9SS type A sorting domain-containing protein [Bacteroidota bacterium]
MTEFKNDLFTLKPVSPNPSNGLVSLEYELKKSTDVSYAVIDASGKTVQRSDSKTKSPSGYRELIDLRSFPSGKYYISFRAGEKILTQRLLIAK